MLVSLNSIPFLIYKKIPFKYLDRWFCSSRSKPKPNCPNCDPTMGQPAWNWEDFSRIFLFKKIFSRIFLRWTLPWNITICLVEWMAPTRSERTFFSSVWMENGGGWSRSEMEYSQHMRVAPVRQNLADEFDLRGFRPSRDGRRLLPRVRATSTPRTTTSTAGAAQGEAASSTSAAAAVTPRVFAQ